jgi:hypothetical protein
VICSRRYAALLVLVLALAAAVAAWGARTPQQPDRELGFGQIRFQGVGPERWAQRWRREHRAVLQLRRVLAHRGSTSEAIELAAATYGSAATLWRRARCESHYNPWARSSSGAAGLFQFLPSTFRSTPYAGLSIWSPYANALAAGWMIAHGRDGEWACR